MESQTPSVVLAAYAEPLLDGRRALVIGDATSLVAAELIARGARSVLVLDPVSERAALGAAQTHGKQITILPLHDADIAVKEGVFDAALVTDLSAVASPAAVLSQLRKALSPRGAALVATPNPDARLHLLPPGRAGASAQREPGTPLGYYELYDLVAAEFTEVRMLGQTPFVGYAVVDFAPDGEPRVALDSGLVPGGAEEPEWFVAVGSREPVELDELSIVQLPLSRILPAEQAVPKGPSRKEAALVDQRLRELEAAIQGKQAEVDRAAAEARRHVALSAETARATESALATAQAKGEAARAEALEAREESEKRLAALKGLEARSASVAVERDQARAKLGAAEAALVQTRSELAATKALADKALADKALADKALADKALADKALADKALADKALADKALADKALADKALADKALARKASVPEGEAPDDLARLEASLRERALHIRKLEGELREARRLSQELLRDLAAARQAPAREAGKAATTPLFAENARLRADLEALGWTVAELEQRLSSQSAPGPRP